MMSFSLRWVVLVDLVVIGLSCMGSRVNSDEFGHSSAKRSGRLSDSRFGDKQDEGSRIEHDDDNVSRAHLLANGKLRVL